MATNVVTEFPVVHHNYFQLCARYIRNRCTVTMTFLPWVSPSEVGIQLRPTIKKRQFGVEAQCPVCAQISYEYALLMKRFLFLGTPFNRQFLIHLGSQQPIDILTGGLLSL